MQVNVAILAVRAAAGAFGNVDPVGRSRVMLTSMAIVILGGAFALGAGLAAPPDI